MALVFWFVWCAYSYFHGFISFAFCAYEIFPWHRHQRVFELFTPCTTNRVHPAGEIDNTIEMTPFVVCAWPVHHLIHLTTIHSFSVWHSITEFVSIVHQTNRIIYSGGQSHHSIRLIFNATCAVEILITNAFSIMSQAFNQILGNLIHWLDHLTQNGIVKVYGDFHFFPFKMRKFKNLIIVAEEIFYKS